MGKRIAVIQTKTYIALILGLLISIKVGPLMPTFAEIEAIDLSASLTLEQCLQLALENSTSVKNNQISLAIQNLRIKDAESNFYPDFSLSGNYTLSDQLRRMQRIREDLDKDTFVLLEQGENYNFGLTGRYTIWDFGQRWLNLLQEKESLKSQESRNERTRQSLIYEVTQAYYEVLKSQALVTVNKEILQRSRDNRQRVEAFVEAGIQIEADIAAAHVQEANNELTLLNNQNQLDIALSNLPRVMGLDPSIRISLAEIEEPMTSVTPPNVTLDKAIEKALKNRPEFVENTTTLNRLQYSLQLARIQRLPTVGVEYLHNMDLDTYFDDFFGTGLSERSGVKAVTKGTRFRDPF